jgi:hypothetical protein
MAIGQDLPDLIRSHISSVWALELLLLLRRTAERAWLPAELSDELRATVTLVTPCMAHFERVGLVARDEGGRYRYAPAAPFLDEFCSALDAEYRERPVAVINLIAAPPDRIQQLADAFRFKAGSRP